VRTTEFLAVIDPRWYSHNLDNSYIMNSITMLLSPVL
jgi:hypothetical protein